MNSIELIYALKERLYDDAFDSYKKNFNKSTKGSDEYSEAIKFFQSLPDTEKEHILFLIKTIMWDTLSDFFSWLDGSYYVSGQTSNVELKLEDQQKNLNGFLQDIWVGIEGGMSKKDIEDSYL